LDELFFGDVALSVDHGVPEARLAAGRSVLPLFTQLFVLREGDLDKGRAVEGAGKDGVAVGALSSIL
jgi:hypothetical protein